MRYLLYNSAWRAAAPWVKRRLAKKHGEESLLERFAPPLPEFVQRPVWIHACSLGEVNTAQPLLHAARETYGAANILLTSSTVTGRDRAHQLCGDRSAWFPIDHPASVQAFLDQLNPRVLVLIETELWPNVLRECARRKIPVVVVNGRLSDKHFARYRKWRGVASSMFASLTAVGAQTAEYAQRFTEMGVPAEHVEITGNLKFDAAPTEVPQMHRAKLRASCGIPEHAPLLLFGSTRPGDEALASACWATLREEFPTLYLAIALRHVERRDEAIAHFGEPVQLRSQLQAGEAPSGARVLLIDTAGELTQFYAAATLAVVGGSFYPGVEGHNPLEPAALGVPTVFGSYMGNFIEPAQALISAQAAVQVACPEDLYGALSGLLRDANALRQMGTRARRVVLDHQGATQRNMHLIARVLAEKENSP